VTDRVSGAGPDFEPARLDAFLRSSFQELKGSMAVDRTVGGMSNPTYFVSYDDWSVVLRKQPNGILARSAHHIDREFRVMSALYGSNVPVPKPLLFHTDASVVGTPFYLMELAGQGFLRRTSSQVSGQPNVRPVTSRCVPSWRPCTILTGRRRDSGTTAGPATISSDSSVVGRNFGISIAARPPNPYLDELLGWLRERVPHSDSATLCHGDFRVPNLMFHAAEPRVIGVLDWELSTLGHPLADVAFNLQAWRMLPEENGGIRGLDWQALGIPAEEDYLQWYYRLRGPTEPRGTFHMAFAMFRAAVGSASIAARGTAAGRPLSIAYARRGVEAIAQV
jgi:aminoglycoside phosphotransferase (APT) family kinase protein